MSNTVTTLDKKAIRKEILVLIVPIILEGIFGYLAGIVSSALVGRLSALAISSQGVVFRITDLLAVFWGSIRIGAMVYFVKLYGEGKYREIIQAFKNICTVTLGIGFIVWQFWYSSQCRFFPSLQKMLRFWHLHVPT